MDTEITKVVFRKFNHTYSGCEIIALFPEIAEEGSGSCLSYQHIGQHGAADYNYCIAISIPATPEEYASLQSELQSIGYNLKIMQRRNSK